MLPADHPFLVFLLWIQPFDLCRLANTCETRGHAVRLLATAGDSTEVHWLQTRRTVDQLTVGALKLFCHRTLRGRGTLQSPIHGHQERFL